MILLLLLLLLLMMIMMMMIFAIQMKKTNPDQKIRPSIN